MKRSLQFIMLLLFVTLWGCSGGGKLTNEKAQQAITQWLINIGNNAATANVTGVLELPQENSAKADVNLSNFVWHSPKNDAITAYVMGPGGAAHTYMGRADAIFAHYNDGRWVLVKVVTPMGFWDNLSIVATGEGAAPAQVRPVPSTTANDIATKDLSDVEARYVLFQLSPEKSKVQTEPNRNEYVGYFNGTLKTQKDIYFGIYAGNDSDKIVLQLTSPDYSILNGLLGSLDKLQISRLEDRTLKGDIGFKFSDRGVLVKIKTRSSFSHQELLKRLNLSNESHVQQLGGGSEYLVWINKADYDAIKKSGVNIESFFKEKLQNEDFNVRNIIENIEDKYTRR